MIFCKKFFLFLSVFHLLIFQGFNSSAQILNDVSSLALVKDCATNIYNIKFTRADEIYNKIKEIYPDHPAVLLLRGMITYWKDYPLVESSPSRYSFENDLHDCIGKCEDYEPGNEAEILLTNLCARGLLLLFYSDNNLSWEVMPLAASTYKYLRRAFDFRGVYPDFYYFTGLYNYYREAYPEAHPIYKTFTFVFPNGDREEGLKELETASRSAILLNAESSSFLSYIYQNYENDQFKSAYYSRLLHENYPDNFQFLIVHIKSLLLGAKYDEAEREIREGYLRSINQYFKAALTIMDGIVQEKKYTNFILSEKLYLQGVRAIEPYGDYGSDFASYAYFGLSRISARNNNETQQKHYRKIANSLTDFKSINFDN